MSSWQNKRQDRDADQEDDEAEKRRRAKKPRDTAAAAGWLLLDRVGYQYVSETDGGRAHVDDGRALCTASAVTSFGAHFQLSLLAEAPPGVTRLVITPPDILSTPYIPFPRSAQFYINVLSSDNQAVLLQLCHQTSCLGADADYFVMDLISPPVLHLLPAMPLLAMTTFRLGLMRRDDGGGGGYVVAALEQVPWRVCFLSSSANAWRRKPARHPPELGHWHVDEVVASGGRFWWVDLRFGLLSCSCDSLLLQDDDEVALEFTPLPNVTAEMARNARDSRYPLVIDRCVAPSAGRLRYVEMQVHRDLSKTSAALTPPPLCDACRGGSVASWTLDDGRGAWAQDHALKLADVWRDESYGSTGLPTTAPEYPLVDPSDPNVVYFSMIIERTGDEGHVFAVDLSTRKVTSCSDRYNGLNSGCEAFSQVKFVN